MQSISVKNATPQSVGIKNASAQNVGVKNSFIIGGEPYQGAYVVTPSSVQQTLATSDKQMLHDVVIQPIPSNYGRIEWNGTTLSVS